MTTTDNKIAVVGLACRFPGARNWREYWVNLRDGVESIRPLTDEELLRSGVPPALTERPTYVRAAAPIADALCFDARFFDVPELEAEALDPQQRVFLECAWSALEDAGYDPRNCPGLVDVYAGAGMNTYASGLADLDPVERAGPMGYLRFISNDKDFLATRVSFKLNLQGRSLTVQTACSTSLVAVNLACDSLLSMQCDMALAGGVSIRFPQEIGYLHQEGMIASADGHCRPFDTRASGTIFGNGCGVVVLKRLSDALEAGDPIRAVVLGSAVNNDGAMKVGYTAPGFDGQVKVLWQAQAAADVDADSIGFVECHGTATKLGDAIEVQALTTAFQQTTKRRGFCALGSVKSNIGHCDIAAGVAGFIKAVLALENKSIPPTLHFTTPNPDLRLDGGPFYVNAKLQRWDAAGVPRRAGVSSFGIGGSNAHVVLEEAPERQHDPSRRRVFVLPLSTARPEGLELAVADLCSALATGVDLADAAYTLQVGRRGLVHRKAFLARVDQAQLIEITSPSVVCGPLVFVFPAGADDVSAWHSALVDSEPAYRAAAARCRDIVAARDSLLAESRAVSQFVAQFALASLLVDFGLQAELAVGVGVGGLVAACVAGRRSVEDVLRAVANGGAPLPTSLASADVSALERLAPSAPLLLQIGPGALAAELIAAAGAKQTLLSTVDPGEAGAPYTALLMTLGRLWEAGFTIDWAKLHAGERRRRVPLPTYPFERRRFGGTRREQAPATHATAPPASAEAERWRALLARNTAETRESVVEGILTELWSSLFGVASEEVSTKSYLELGGDSLIAFGAVSRLKAAGLSLGIEDVLASRSLRELAATVVERDEAKAESQ